MKLPFRPRPPAGSAAAKRIDVFKGAGHINRPFLAAFKAFGRLVSHTYLRVQCEGAEYAPQNGAYLIVTNHISGLDSFLIGFMLRRPVYCLAKVELYQGRFLTWALNSMGYIPLDRSKMDIPAMRIVLQLLKQGQAVGIAPEGTRSRTGELLPFTDGATKLALHARVPLLPVSVYGTRELMPPGSHFFKPGRVYIKFGPLFDLGDAYDKPVTPELLEECTAIIYERVAELFAQIRHRPLK